MKRWISFVLMLTMLLSLPAGAFAKTPFYEDSKAIARAAESVLMLTCYDKEGNAVSTGSGFLAFEDGIIITNYHVIEGITGAIKANTEDGMYFDINEILCTDPAADVAILKTKARTRLDLLTLGSSSSLGKGSRVVAIGSPLGLLNTVSEGIYSGIVVDETEYILFTAAISSGSSGGALFNENGEVIGVTAATYTEGQNLNLAVPIENVRKLWNRYQSGEYDEATRIEQPTNTGKTDGEEAFFTAEKYYEEEKYTEAVEWYTRAAEQGHAEAQYMLGECYRNGIGVEKDYTSAVKWYEKAADQGIADAQYLLGVYYSSGFSGFFLALTNLENCVKVVELFTKAAQQGHAPAQNLLGHCYSRGYGVQVDYFKAVEWYTKAVEQGNYDGIQRYLSFAETYMRTGDSKAEYMYLAAAEAGFADAQCELGNLLYFGKTGKKDIKEAAYWYEKAVEQNHAEACYRLAGCYEYGMGVEKDKIKANELYAKARQLGYSH